MSSNQIKTSALRAIPIIPTASWRLAALLFLFLCAPSAAEQPLDLLWIKQFGSSGLDTVDAIAADAAGYVYVAGGSGGTLTDVTARDAFVAKYDASGTRLWYRQFGASDWAIATDLVIDRMGNLYVVGATAGSFSPDIFGDRSDAFLAKYDALGNQLWIRQFGTPHYDFAEAVAIDAAGGVYVGGWFSAASEDADSFLTKYDDQGNRLWTQGFGIVGLDEIQDLTMDAAGSIYVSGIVQSALPGQVWAGGSDGFIAKFNAAGREQWLHQVGTAGEEYWFSLTTNPTGGVYVVGSSDQGSGPYLTLSNYNASGVLIWTRDFGSNVYPWWTEIASDPATGTVYLAGTTSGTIVGQPAFGEVDLFVAQFDAEGNQTAVRRVGSSAYDVATAAAVDSAGSVYVGGWTAGALPDQTFLGELDAVLVKLQGQPRSASDEIDALRSRVAQLSLDIGLTRSLDAKLLSAAAAVRRGGGGAACGALGAFTNELRASSSKRQSAEQVRQLIDVSEQIRSAIDCR